MIADIEIESNPLGKGFQRCQKLPTAGQDQSASGLKDRSEGDSWWDVWPVNRFVLAASFCSNELAHKESKEHPASKGHLIRCSAHRSELPRTFLPRLHLCICFLLISFWPPDASDSFANCHLIAPLAHLPSIIITIITIFIYIVPAIKVCIKNGLKGDKWLSSADSSDRLFQSLRSLTANALSPCLLASSQASGTDKPLPEGLKEGTGSYGRKRSETYWEQQPKRLQQELCDLVCRFGLKALQLTFVHLGSINRF